MLVLLVLQVLVASAQVSIFPYKESFDTVSPPTLPFGWTTTTNKNNTGDFVVTQTSVRTTPNAVSSTDATKSQSLTSPLIDFSNASVDSLEFYERRTSTHRARVIVEASINSDPTFGILISLDSLRFISSTSYARRAFRLPDTLSGRIGVRFRIRIIADSSGSSGVYRIDDVRLTVQKRIDLSVSSYTVSPIKILHGDQLNVLIGIKNLALSGNISGTIQLKDSVSIVSSQIFSKIFAKTESLTIQMMYEHITAGRHPMSIVLTLDGDEDTTNNSLFFSVNAGYRQGIMLINEFMYTPSSGTPEWIEVVNNSRDTIPTSGWKISDAGATKSPLTSSGRTIPPFSYAIVTTDTNTFKDYYSTSAPLFQSSFSSLNNNGDAVVLYDHNNNVIDSLFFLSSWGGVSGISLERIDTAASSNMQTNWKTSRHRSGATPGTINSVTQKSYDISLSRISPSVQFPVSGNVISVFLTVKNIGKQNISSATIELYIDANRDSLLSINELHHQQRIGSVTTNDSTTVQITLPSLPQGIHWLFANIFTSQDDDTTNNSIFFPLTIGIQPHSIVINEVMYSPTGDLPEWIEGYNTTNVPINTSGWKISDNGSTKALIQGREFLIPANSYFIISPDTIQFKTAFPFASVLLQAAFPALNNTTSDAVVLFDERGTTMDSINYSPRWGGTNGYSLQRFDVQGNSCDSINWRSATPSAGRENNIARKDYDVELQRIEVKNQSNYISIRIILFNSGRFEAQPSMLKFYYDINKDSSAQNNELISSISVPSILSLDSTVSQYDWKIAEPGKQQIIARIEYPHDERIENNSKITIVEKSFSSQSVVINEIMYDPQTGNAEFVELLNLSGDTVDVADWKLMDQPSSSGSRSMMVLSTTSRRIPSGDFMIMASDSSLFTQFPSLHGKNVSIHSSLSLSNSGEDLILVDLTGNAIDSVHYAPWWHLKNLSSSGHSLERINPAIQANDDRNWSSSVDRNGSTPGKHNSIYTASVSFGSSLALSPNPFSPDQDGFEDFLSINYSLPTNSATIRIRIYDVTGRLIRRLANNESFPSSGSIIWNGLDDEGHRVRIGMYIILMEALDNFGGVAKTMKDVAVVARKL